MGIGRGATPFGREVFVPRSQGWTTAERVALFRFQWGTILVASPLLSGHTINFSRTATAPPPSLISPLVSIYLAITGPVVGAVAGVSVAASFALMGALVIAGALTIRIDVPAATRG